MPTPTYKAWFTFRNDPPATNGIVLATREEVDRYASNLMQRWYVPTGWEVRESTEPVNYRWDVEANKLVNVATAKG